MSDLVLSSAAGVRIDPSNQNVIMSCRFLVRSCVVIFSEQRGKGSNSKTSISVVVRMGSPDGALPAIDKRLQ